MDEKKNIREKKTKRVIEEDSVSESEYDSEHDSESEYKTEDDTDYKEGINIENSEISKMIKDILKNKSDIVFNIFPNQYDDLEANDILIQDPVPEISEEGKKIKDILDAKEKEVNDFNMLNNPLKLTNRERVLMANIDSGTKSSILDKIKSKSTGDEGVKTDQWVENFLKIPFNQYKTFGLESTSETDIKKFLVELKKNLDKSVYGMDEVKNEIMSFVVKKIVNPDAKGTILALQGPKGTAKCLDPETLVLKYNGKLSKVKDLVKGDSLMGDDNRPKFITGTASGIDHMYTIHQKYGNSYKVNKEHILCLKNVFTKKIKEISVKNYLKKSYFFKKMYKGYHVPIEYTHIDFIEDPFKLGKKFNKKIPEFILTNSMVIRRLYLEGICGYRFGFKKMSEEIVIKVPPSKDLERLIWSLGYTITSITENSLTFIRKNKLEKIKIVYNGRGRYCGFELTGNGRFLFKDNSVSHNTRIARKGIAESLNIPFHSINFGGMKDSSLLVGHDLTYVGSSYGKICQILINSGCMNPIIYLDECDKVSGEHARDIFGVLTHLLDEEQNKEFEDNYFKGIKIDLSKALFIISFNDLEQIDHIAADRMRIIKIKPPTNKEKIKILQNILIPEINENNKNNNIEIIINEEMVKYILNITEEEEGMRKVRENIKKLLERINLCWYSGGTYLPEVYAIIQEEISKTTKNSSPKNKKLKTEKIKIIINKQIVDKIISKIDLSNNHSHMYI